MESSCIPLHVYPGPIEASLLTRQLEHRSTFIWEGDEASTFHSLTFRRCDSLFWRAYPRASPRVVELIDQAGFGGVSRVGHIHVDWSLVTALVERWRPETHTFHLPVGEATITLQDVAVLWGLRVDGNPIIGDHCRRTRSEWQQTCHHLLGFVPEVGDLKGNKLSKQALEDRLLVPLPVDATEDEVARHARRFILLLVGGLLFSDKSGRFLPLRYLIHLEDLHVSGTLSWGSAILAYLYRCLCDASMGISREICGPMVLLQLWAWEHLPVLRPETPPAQHFHPLAPYGARWYVPLDLSRTPTHVLLIYRDQLDSLVGSDQFIWTPYDDHVIQSLSPRYIEGSDIWCAQVPLICWEIVEYYLPDRVMRQFSFEQFPPSQPDTRPDLHKLDQRGNMTKTWDSFHTVFVEAWRGRREQICTGLASANVQVPRTDYMEWYHAHTRLLIGNPSRRTDTSHGFQGTGSRLVMMASAIRQVMSMAGDGMPHAEPHSYKAFASIQDVCARVLATVGDSLSCQNMSRQADTATAVLDPAIQHLRDRIAGRAQRGARRGGKRRHEEIRAGFEADDDTDAHVDPAPREVPVAQEIPTPQEDHSGASLEIVCAAGPSCTSD